MKFLALLKKEVRDVINFQLILGLIISIFVFIFLGGFIKNISETEVENLTNLQIIDQDKSEQSKETIDLLKNSGFNVFVIEDIKDIKESALIFSSGFGKNIFENKTTDIELYSKVSSLSNFSSASSSSSTNALSIISNFYKNKIISQDLSSENMDFFNNPISIKEKTEINNKVAEISSSTIKLFAISQTAVLPIIIFMIIVIASQMVSTAIANEKGDKTLETLLSTPISRISILLAKISASALVAIVMSSIYVVGFFIYMTGESNSSIDTSLFSDLGIKLSGFDFIFIGIQLFLTILIAISISIVLGAFSKDVKSAQITIAPLMISVLIPYILSILSDIQSLPPLIRFIVNLIPFTHTFTAGPNLILQNNFLFLLGIVYQSIFLIAILFIAIKVFSSDAIFTVSTKSRKFKKKISM